MLKLLNLKANLSLYTKVLVILPIFFLGFSFISNKVDAYVLETPSSSGFFDFVDSDQTKVLCEVAGYECEQENGTVGVYGKGALDNVFSGISMGTTGKKFSEFTIDKNLAGDQDSGIVNMLNNLNTALLDQRPLSTQDFIQDKVYALTGAVQAQDAPAQYFPGTGYQLLEPIQAFWGWSVNVVFAFLILIIIGIALAIVFRQNIGGAQMVTIQNAIPSIAMALILVPLSYSISGVFIDAITVGTNAVHQFFFGVGAPARSVYEGVVKEGNDGRTDGCTETTDNPCNRGLYADDYRLDWWNFRNLVDVSDEVEGVANTSVAGQGINSLVLMDIIKRVLDLLAGNSKPAAYWFGEIVNAIFGILMIWIGIKIAIKLLSKYLILVLTPIISPFIFASVAVPGNSTKAIVNYLKMMGAASLFYIVTYLMFVLTFVFTSSVFNDQLPNFSRGLYIPPLLGLRELFDSLPSGSSRSLINLLFSFVGLGIYFSIPKVLESIDTSLDQKFVIPTFLKTPFESLQESFKVTRGAGARALQLTARGGRTTASGLRNLGYNATKAYEQTIKGIKADVTDPNSVAFRRKQENLRRRQEILARLDEIEGDPTKFIERQGLLGELKRLDIDEGLQGSEFSSKSEEGKSRFLTAKVYYGSGGDSSYVFDFNRIYPIWDKFMKAPKGTVITEEVPLGLLQVTAENISLNAKEVLVFGNTIKSSQNQNVFNEVDYPVWDGGPNGTPIFGGLFDQENKIYTIPKTVDFLANEDNNKKNLLNSNPGKIRIRALVPKTGLQKVDVEESKKINIPLILVIENDMAVFEEFFGKYDNRVKRFVGGYLTKVVQTDNRAVKIQSKMVSSYGFKIKMQKSNV